MSQNSANYNESQYLALTVYGIVTTSGIGGVVSASAKQVVVETRALRWV
jgi:hypothetical protein